MNIKIQSSAFIPTDLGMFNMISFSDDSLDKMPHVALIKKGTNLEMPVFVRVHSECMTGDLFGSNRCDCGEQLDHSLKIISEHGGVLLYLRQEGRGIGLINKLKAYNLQDKGLDTAEANVHLGFEIDERQFDIAEEMLELLGIKKIKLLTNNPEKMKAFTKVEVLERVPLFFPTKKENKKYIQTKKDVFGHLY